MGMKLTWLAAVLSREPVAAAEEQVREKWEFSGRYLACSRASVTATILSGHPSPPGIPHVDDTKWRWSAGRFGARTESVLVVGGLEMPRLDHAIVGIDGPANKSLRQSIGRDLVRCRYTLGFGEDELGDARWRLRPEAGDIVALHPLRDVPNVDRGCAPPEPPRAGEILGVTDVVIGGAKTPCLVFDCSQVLEIFSRHHNEVIEEAHRLAWLPEMLRAEGWPCATAALDIGEIPVDPDRGLRHLLGRMDPDALVACLPCDGRRQVGVIVDGIAALGGALVQNAGGPLGCVARRLGGAMRDEDESGREAVLRGIGRYMSRRWFRSGMFELARRAERGEPLRAVGWFPIDRVIAFGLRAIRNEEKSRSRRRKRQSICNSASAAAAVENQRRNERLAQHELADQSSSKDPVGKPPIGPEIGSGTGRSVRSQLKANVAWLVCLGPEFAAKLVAALGAENLYDLPRGPDRLAEMLEIMAQCHASAEIVDGFLALLQQEERGIAREFIAAKRMQVGLSPEWEKHRRQYMAAAQRISRARRALRNRWPFADGESGDATQSSPGSTK